MYIRISRSLLKDSAKYLEFPQLKIVAKAGFGSATSTVALYLKSGKNKLIYYKESVFMDERKYLKKWLTF